MPDDFLDARLTERRNPRTVAIDVASPLEIVDLIAAEDAGVPAAVATARVEIAAVVGFVEAAFRAGGRLVYVGAGTSGRLGVLDAAECPPTFGTPPEMVIAVIAGGAPALVRSIEGAEDDVNAGISAMDERRVNLNDVVVGIAASGTTPYVRAALGRAQALGARTALVTCAEPPAVLRDTCDVIVFVPVGPEAVTGSTRLKAGTATKLVDRSRRIIMETTGLDRNKAGEIIAKAEGHVKRAIVMARRGVSRDEADRLLAEHQGRLRHIVGDPPPVRKP